MEAKGLNVQFDIDIKFYVVEKTLEFFYLLENLTSAPMRVWHEEGLPGFLNTLLYNHYSPRMLLLLNCVAGICCVF